MLKDILKVTDRVEHILKKYPVTRDSDKLLWLSYMNLFCGLRAKIGKENYQILKKIFLSSPMPESIRRCRQKIQEEGRHLGEKRKERLAEEQRMRKWAQGLVEEQMGVKLNET